ncbi:MAG: DNA pilot protein [Arizlama microvirus]|nr:MAG: DNA pilot protein [Arizlama microvirus]
MPNPLILPAVVSAATAAGQALAQGGPKRQYKWNKKAAEDANRMNRDNQSWLLQQQKDIQREQREYDSPESQMSRYQAAGLNPHLIYGSGASAGQAFPIDSGQIAPARLDAPDASYPDIAGNFLRAGNNLSSMGLTNQRIGESQARTALTGLQTDIAKTNPMLSPSVANWVASSLEETARQKAMTSRYMLHMNPGDTIADTRMGQLVDAEVQTMVQKLGLNTADLQIKNRILQSKEFENAVKEIQAKWMKDSEITPEHIRQGLMLLLTKMLGK